MKITTPEEVTVRLYHQADDGSWHDYQREYTLEDFAGVVPCIGDKFLEPGVLEGQDRYEPKNRHLYTVVERIFNPRDRPNCIVLVVTEITPTGREATIVA